MFFLQSRLLFLPDKGKVVILLFTISVSAAHALAAKPILFFGGNATAFDFIPYVLRPIQRLKSAVNFHGQKIKSCFAGSE